MDKVLIDRAVVEQALEALEGSTDFVRDDCKHMWAAVTAIRAALEQPVEQEPVAWRWIGRKGWVEYGPIKHDLFDCEPLYLHPQPPRRPPLPDEQIDFMFANAGTGEYLAERERIRHLEIYSFGVRDAEAAHEIKD